MKEQQPTLAQPSTTPTPPKRFPWKKLILGLFVLLLLSGGVCSVLAWKTTYLDNYLPANVKEFFGRSEEVGKGEEEPVPPVISSVKATNITETGATITWETDVEATSQVEYGTTINYGFQTKEDTTLVTSHSAALTSLTKATTYHYRVKSQSGEGELTVSKDYTFTTTDPYEGWKTYTDPDNIYSIKYPPEWSVHKEYDGCIKGSLEEGYGCYTYFLGTKPFIYFTIGKLDAVEPSYGCRHQGAKDLPPFTIDGVKTYEAFKFERDPSAPRSGPAASYPSYNYCVISPTGRDLQIHFSPYVVEEKEEEGIVAIFYDVLETMEFK